MARIVVFTQALAEFAADGFRTVSREQYAHRLEVCEACDRRSHQSCTVCGCKLRYKARARRWDCPLSRWLKIDRTTGDYAMVWICGMESGGTGAGGWRVVGVFTDHAQAAAACRDARYFVFPVKPNVEQSDWPAAATDRPQSGEAAPQHSSPPG